MSYQDWNVAFGLDRQIEILKELALRHSRLGGESFHKAFSELLLSGNYGAAAKFSVNYESGLNPWVILNQRQAIAFFQKFPALPGTSPEEREAKAFAKFMEAESQCRETNLLFMRLCSSDVTNLSPDHVKQLFAARGKIHRILGEAPKVCDLGMTFGPGATTRTKKSESCPAFKMSAGLSCSNELAYSGYLEVILSELPHWTASLEGTDYCIDDEGWLVEKFEVAIDDGNLQFVPKDAFIDRTIIVEPPLNTLMQQGVRKAMERRMARVGLATTDQTINQRLALQGSLKGDLATIDLSSASDTICYWLVKFLFPADWFRLLASCRTKTVRYKGQTIHQEKFSSMGNSTTFPVETLIFWALSSVCSPELCSVYGDDIIVTAAAYKEVTSLLELCGFTVNRNKSFSTGPFRESCGADYYMGINVRPLYIKEEVSPKSMYLIHNYYVRNFDEEGAAMALKWIPDHLRLYGPDGYGDGHLVSDSWDMDSRPLRKELRQRGFGGRFFDTLSFKPKRIRSRWPGDWVSPLYSIYIRGEDPGLPTHFKGNTPYWVIPGGSAVVRTKIYTFLR